MRATRLAFSLIVVWPSSAAAVGPRGPLSATERKRLATARSRNAGWPKQKGPATECPLDVPAASLCRIPCGHGSAVPLPLAQPLH